MEISANTYEDMAKTVTDISLTIFLDEFLPAFDEDDRAACYHGEFSDDCNAIDEPRVNNFQTNLEEQLQKEFPNANITISRDFVDYASSQTKISFNHEHINDAYSYDAYQAVAEIYEEVLRRS